MDGYATASVSGCLIVRQRFQACGNDLSRPGHHRSVAASRNSDACVKCPWLPLWLGAQEPRSCAGALRLATGSDPDGSSESSALSTASALTTPSDRDSL